MKMREDHLVPLSKQALEILHGLKSLTGHGKYVLHSIRNMTRGDRPMSESTITAALRRLGFSQDEMCAHSFLGMATTVLNEQGWPPDVIERALKERWRMKKVTASDAPIIKPPMASGTSKDAPALGELAGRPEKIA